MQEILTKAENIVSSLKVNLDGRGVVSFPKRKQFPILESDMKIVWDWISRRIDFGDSRSSYGIQSEIQYATLSSSAVSNGSIIAVILGLGNEFHLDRGTLEISFPNRIVLVPNIVKIPDFYNLLHINPDPLVFKIPTPLQKQEMKLIIEKEWEETKFGFNSNLKEILPHKYLLGIFYQDDLIGFVVCASQIDTSPLFFEIFPKYRLHRYASNVVQLLHFEMRGHLSVIQSIEEARGFWTKMGYQPLNTRNLVLMAKIC
jgi:hypothetical protein